jgi:flagellin
MGFSVNTNVGALAALRSLNNTSRELNVTQNRVNTGLRVSSAKDNASSFNIAQNIRANIGGLNAVKSSLDRGSSTIDVALAAAEAVSDILIEMREKAVAAKDVGLDTASFTALNSEFKELRTSITSIVLNAAFNGTNVLLSDSISALIADDGGTTISVANQILTITTGLSIDIADIGDSTKAISSVVSIDAAIVTVGNALAKLGSASKSMENQRAFVDTLSDALTVGIGNLVDADLAKESANLQALQVKQQLGIQALSIANQAPASILALFQ